MHCDSGKTLPLQMEASTGDILHTQQIKNYLNLFQNMYFVFLQNSGFG